MMNHYILNPPRKNQEYQGCQSSRRTNEIHSFPTAMGFVYVSSLAWATQEA
jgi:hypothetical protein